MNYLIYLLVSTILKDMKHLKTIFERDYISVINALIEKNTSRGASKEEELAAFEKAKKLMEENDVKKSQINMNDLFQDYLNKTGFGYDETKLGMYGYHWNESVDRSMDSIMYLVINQGISSEEEEKIREAWDNITSILGEDEAYDLVKNAIKEEASHPDYKRSWEEFGEEYDIDEHTQSILDYFNRVIGRVKELEMTTESYQMNHLKRFNESKQETYRDQGHYIVDNNRS